MAPFLTVHYGFISPLLPHACTMYTHTHTFVHEHLYLYVHMCRHLSLDNELEVLLVSDASTEKAAASLAVRVG